MRPIPKIRAGIPPTEILKKIIRAEPMKAKDTGPSAPVVTWLTEPDERLSAALFMDDSTNRIFTVSNPAYQLIPSLAAIDFGVRELLTPVLLIAGSSDSRFVKLFLDGYLEQSQEMRQTLDHLHLPLASESSGAPRPAAEKTETLLAAVEKNIDFQVKEAIARYGDRVEGGRLLVAGGVIDLDNAYGHGKNRLILININGETDPQKMRMMREVATIGQKFAPLLGRTKPPTAASPPNNPENQTKAPPRPAAGK